MKHKKLIQGAVSACFFATAVSVAATSHAASVGENPFAHYGEKIVFDVIRKDDKVGTHEVTFTRDGDDIIATSRFEVSIKVLIVPVYSYLYTSTERWRNGKLISLSAETNDNGDLSELKVSRANGKLVLTGSGGDLTADGGLYPTTHWNSGVIGSTEVINTITGKINAVTMENRGVKSITTNTGKRPATHFAYQGDLSTEVWYDSAGKWVKMRFPGKDGVMIEYRCQQCGAHPTKTGRLHNTVKHAALNHEAHR